MNLSKLFYKLFLSIILFIILFCSIIQPAGALSDLSAESLNLAAEIAKGQDATAGVEKYAKDKYSEWLWEAAGGYETLLSGVGESQIKKVKGRFDLIQTAINGLSKLALTIDAGNYDEGLYHVVETSVSTVNHPLVNVTWEAVKLTYQSHQMLVATEAERQIEVLFAELHNDRRLFSNENDGMKQIPINSDTVDYFFNDYIVTNASMRGRVKNYVEVRLNETWPEESWGTWFKNLRLIGSGIDIEEAEETEALTGKYKNTARGWIRSLMEDVNLEAQRWYHQMQVRKLMTEFEIFKEEFNAFDADINEILETFLRIKEIKAKEDFYRNFLVESEKKHQKINKHLAKADKRLTYSSLYNEGRKWKSDCVSYMSQVRYAGMKSLADSYLRHYKDWIDLLDKINANMPPIIDDPGEAYQETYPEVERKPANWEIITAITIGLLEEPYFIENKGDIDQLKSEFRGLLENRSYDIKNTLLDLRSLSRIVEYDWGPASGYKVNGYYSQYNDELKRISGASNRRYILYEKKIMDGEVGDISEKEEAALHKIESAVQQKVDQEIAKHNKGDWSVLYDYWEDDDGNNKSRLNKAKVRRFKISLVEGAVNTATNIVKETIVSPAVIYLKETDRWFQGRYQVLQQRISMRKKQYNEIFEYVDNINRFLFGDVLSQYEYNESLLLEKMILHISDDSYLSYIDEREEYVKEKILAINNISYIDYYKGTPLESQLESRDSNWMSNNDLVRTINISSMLENHAKDVRYGRFSSTPSADSDFLTFINNYYDSNHSRIEKVELIWDKIKIPTSEEEQEIRELVDKDFSIAKLKKMGVEIERQMSEIQQVPDRIDGIERLLEEDYKKRKNISDELKDMAFRINMVCSKLESAGYIQANSDRVFQLSFPTSTKFIGSSTVKARKSKFAGMFLTADPYPHLMEKEEINALQKKITSVIKDKFTKSGLYNFYSSYAPNAFKTLTDILSLKRISDYEEHPAVKAASEAMIVHPNYMDQENPVEGLAYAGNFTVIRESSLAEAEEILKETVKIVKGEVNENYRLIEEREFIDNISIISELLPLTVEVRSYPAAKDVSVGGRVTINESGEKVLQEIKYIIEEENLNYLKDHPLAEKYKEVALGLREVLYKYYHRAEEEYQKESKRMITYDELAYIIEGAIDSVEFFIREKDYENALLYDQELEKLKSEHRNLPGEDPGSRCPDLLKKLEALIKEAEKLRSEKDKEKQEILNKINKFYDKFSRYYQSQDEFAVLSLLADDWQAADSTTLWDLEDTLIRNFRVFDEISYQITNLEMIETRGNNRYLVHYDLKIVSQIYDKNIKHEEISSVKEIIEIKEDNSSGRILQTLDGHFWKK